MQEFISALFEPVTLVIIVFIIIVAIWKRDKNLVTLLWIFWTFLGIVIGLHEIDSENIANSIPNLLSGLSTAFYTSIAWLIASIMLTFSDEEDNKDSEDFLRDISEKLSDLIDLQEGIKEIPNLKQELISLNKNVWWDGDSSLLSQIQKLRTSFNDKQDELKKAFDDFAKEMSENNMKALIEAIQKVMEDFNTKINDQLWQSFKELTTAIDNLLKWQEEYKENIITSTEALKLSKESLEKSSKWFEITVEQSEKFSWISESLWNELKTLNDSLEILKSWLKEFDGIANNNKDASEKLIESLESLKNNFVSKAEIMVSESEAHIKNMKEAFERQSWDLSKTHNEILENLRISIDNTNKQTSEHFIKIWTELSNQSQKITETFEKQSEDLIESHKNILEDLKNNVDNTNKNVSEQFVRIWDELERQVAALDNNIRERYEQFDEKLQEELTKSLSSLWRELTSVSEHFVNDYSVLAKKLESLITSKN